MHRRAGRAFAAFFVAALLLGPGMIPAAGAESAKNIGGFIGTADSHAVKLTIGDIELTVGGGESRASYERTATSNKLSDVKALANARGIIIPGLADSQVSCVPPKLTDSLSALATPDALKPLLDAKLGLASCSLGMKSLPKAEHSAGELVADVNLTKTVVQSVPQVNEFLDTVQGQLGALPADLRGQANSTIDAIQQQLASKPVVELRVAPNRGAVSSTKPGISSVSPGSAVTLDVLGGVLQIQIAVAETAASIVDGKPAASANVALVHVKALNILTPDPNDALIDQTISAPQDLTVLAGTPLETRIATERGRTSTACEGDLARFDACAAGTADAVAVSLLASPLPNISLELVHTGVLAAGNFAPAAVKDRPVLPRTGAGAAGVVVGGLVLTVGGLGLRRRFVR